MLQVLRKYILSGSHIRYQLLNITTREQAKQFNKGSTAALKSLAEKNRKYREKCYRQDIGFHALIFESTGRPLQNTIDFISKLVKNNSDIRGISSELSVRYWLTALSFSIQNAIGDSIRKRALLLNSRQLAFAHYKDLSNLHMNAADCIDGKFVFDNINFENSEISNDLQDYINPQPLTTLNISTPSAYYYETEYDNVNVDEHHLNQFQNNSNSFRMNDID
jgi:hypothetical protein